MLIDVTFDELDEIMDSIRSSILFNEQNVMHCDNSTLESIHLKLSEYRDEFLSVPKTWVVKFELDNGAVSETKTAVCKANDEDDAAEAVKEKFEVFSDDTVKIISIDLLGEEEVIPV